MMSVEKNMDIESLNQPKSGFMARSWAGFKALSGRVKDNVVGRAESVKKLGQDDPRRIIHSIKVGLTLAVVSLIYYIRPLYDGFGVAGIWAILTVVVIFEFSVGATLSKGLNRGLATLLAGALGVGAHYLGSLCGEKGEPIVLGIFVFILAAASTFSRFFPVIKARYDYGVIVFILTFSLVTISGYRVDQILTMAHQRLSTIIIGGATCIFVAIFVCPVWAGQDLHKLIALNIEKLASYLEGFGGECFKVCEDGESKDNKSFLQAYKSVLNSKTIEENLANFARWEPGHGRFFFRHPWKQYLKIGALTRQCAYQIEALNGYVNSEIEASHELLSTVQESCTKLSSESGKALKALSSSIKTMTDPSVAHIHIENSKKAINELKVALKEATLQNTNLLEIIPVVTIASILIEIVSTVDKINDCVHELARLARFKNPGGQEKPHLMHRGSVQPVSDGNPVIVTLHEIMIMDKDFSQENKGQKLDA